MYVHYSHSPITKIHDMFQVEGYNLKPIGLWISDESNYGWKEWCIDNSPDFLGDMEYEIELDESANILWLKTPEDIDAFTFCYRLEMYNIFNELSHVIAIDWLQLSKEYDGIMITPYQWSRRIGSPSVWYYGWDVASGCIWNSKAILASKLLNQIDKETEVPRTP